MEQIEGERKCGRGSEVGGDSCGERRTGGVVEGLRAPLDAQAGAFAGIIELGDDVKVDVQDGLVGGGSVVLKDVVGGRAGGVDDGPAEAREGAAQGGGGVVGELIERRPGFLGDHERVAGAERTDIQEGEDGGVFVDLVAGDFAADDPGENGVAHERIVIDGFEVGDVCGGAQWGARSFVVGAAWRRMSMRSGVT